MAEPRGDALVRMCRGVAETHQTPAATYATAYNAFWEAANSPSSKAKYDCALRGHPRGVLSYSCFCYRLLAAPPEDVI